jgi:hypothetical protein
MRLRRLGFYDTGEIVAQITNALPTNKRTEGIGKRSVYSPESAESPAAAAFSCL